MTRDVSHAALIVALLAGAPALAHAAEATRALDEITVTAQASDLNLAQPTGAAGRLGLTSLQTPASVAVVSGDLVRSLGIGGIAEASALAPGVSTVPFAGTGNQAIAARGFYGVNSLTQSYDGMQLYNAGGVIDFPFDTWNVERIEVLNGPASVLYGAGAIGGSLNVVSKKPNTTAFMNSAEASVGSYITYHAAVDSTGPINKRLSYRLNASYRESQGWVDTGSSKGLALSAAIRFEATPQLALSVIDDYGNIYPSTYEGTPTVNGKVIRDLRFKNFNTSDARINFNENRIRLNIDWRPNENVSFQNDTYLITHARNYTETYTYAFTATNNTVRRTTYRDIVAFQTQYGDHGYLNWKGDLFGLKNNLSFGFDANNGVYNRRDNALGGSFPGTTTVNAFNFDQGVFADAKVIRAVPEYKVTVGQYGGFVQDRLSFTDQVSMVVGLRSDHYKTERTDYVAKTFTTGQYNGTGWNVGLVYNPRPDISLYAQYATAEDPVTSLQSISTSQLLFNLSPGRQVEAGIKGSAWGGRFEGTLSAYKIIKKDLLAPSLANPAITEQVGQQSSRGIEAQVALHLTKTLQIDANGTVLDPHFDSFFANVGGKRTSLEGKIPQFVPKKLANVRALWTFAPRWQLRASYQYVDTRWSDNTNTFKMPAYYLVNVGLRWAVNNSVSLDLRADNALNRVYVASTYAGVGSQMILGAPRTYTATVDVAF